MEHDLEHHKQLEQNAPNHELALSLVLQRGYHDMATGLCGSNILQVLDFGLFQESLCGSSVQVTLKTLINEIRNFVCQVYREVLRTVDIASMCAQPHTERKLSYSLGLCDRASLM